MKSKKSQEIVSMESYKKLYQLFEEKGWMVEEDIHFSAFERYYRTLSSLDNDEQSFIIDLSKNFLHIPSDEYTRELIPAIKDLIQCISENILYFTCCLPEGDIGKIKSSTTVLYKFKGTTIKQKVDFKEKSISVVEDIKSLKKIDSFANRLIVLVDDFIGTGQTAEAAIDYVKKELTQLHDNSQIVVLSIVAHEMGIEFLSKLGIKVYATHKVRKGISDNYIGESLAKALEQMSEIENRLKKLKSEFRFGYGKSEALVCMERCPNNTFPIYWYTKNDAPYER